MPKLKDGPFIKYLPAKKQGYGYATLSLHRGNHWVFPLSPGMSKKEAINQFIDLIIEKLNALRIK